jgi:hypothetical protein
VEFGGINEVIGNAIFNSRKVLRNGQRLEVVSGTSNIDFGSSRSSTIGTSIYLLPIHGDGASRADGWEAGRDGGFNGLCDVDRSSLDTYTTSGTVILVLYCRIHGW